LAKKKEPQGVHPPTQRQLTHWQRQALRQRMIALSGIFIIVAVIAVVFSGVYFQWYLPVYKPLQATVVEVNGHKFDMAYYIDALVAYDQLYFSGQTDYLSMLLDTTAQNIEQIELVREEAAKLNIVISEDDITKIITDNSLSNSQAMRDIVRGQLLSDKLKTDYFGPQILSSAEHRDVLAIFLESQSQLDEIKAQIDAGADFGQVAAQFSLDSTTKGDGGALGYKPKGLLDYMLSSTALDDAVFSQQVGTRGTLHDADKTKQVGYWLVKVTEKKDDMSQVHVFGMLLSSQEEAQAVKARLDAGEDFTTLAQQFSQTWSDASKDDMGWISSDTTEVFKDYVFDTNTPLNAVSSPIKDTTQSTRGGYWLFKVVDSVVKDISEDDKTSLISQAFSAWLTEKQTDKSNSLSISLNESQKTFATGRAKTQLSTT